MLYFPEQDSRWLCLLIALSLLYTTSEVEFAWNGNKSRNTHSQESRSHFGSRNRVCLPSDKPEPIISSTDGHVTQVLMGLIWNLWVLLIRPREFAGNFNGLRISSPTILELARFMILAAFFPHRVVQCQQRKDLLRYSKSKTKFANLIKNSTLN